MLKLFLLKRRKIEKYRRYCTRSIILTVLESVEIECVSQTVRDYSYDEYNCSSLFAFVFHQNCLNLK